MPQDIPVQGNKEIIITVREDTQALDEVVVVGYGTQKKVNLTGSVSSVKFDEELANRPITDASQALSGRFPACGSARIRVSREMMERN